MTDTLIGAYIGIGGAFIGAISTYFLSKLLARQAHKNALEIIQTNEFNKAATKFRDSFAEELAILKSRQNGDAPDAYDLLERAFQKHLMAINEFRHYLSTTTVPAFNNDWDNYHKYDNEHFLKQYSDDAEGFHDKYRLEPYLMAVERIEKLLSHARPK